MKSKKKFKIGNKVQVISDVITKGKEGKISKNDSVSKDYRVIFNNGWQGYYMENELEFV